MGLRFFADQCVPYSIIEILQNEGHVGATRRVAPTRAILISLNGDFADIVTYPPRNYEGIIAIPVRNHPEVIPQIIGRLKKYLSTHNNETSEKIRDRLSLRGP